jgi:hypothetical protein
MCSNKGVFLMEAQANVQPVVHTTVTDLVVPVDIKQIASFTDLKLSNPSTVARKTLIRAITVGAVDEEWQALTPLLAPNGDYAGGAQFAHAVVCDRVFQARESEFEAVGGVTLRELWPIVHELLKKRGLVFERGFVTGMRR